MRMYRVLIILGLGFAVGSAAAQTSTADSLTLERARAANREVDLLLSAPIDTCRVVWNRSATATVTVGGMARTQRLWIDREADWVIWAADTSSSTPFFLIRRDGSVAYHLHPSRTSATAVAPELGRAMGLLRPMGPLPEGGRRAPNAFRSVRGVRDTLLAAGTDGMQARAVFGPKDRDASDVTGSWIRVVGPRGWDAFVYPSGKPLTYLELTDPTGKLLFRFENCMVSDDALVLDLGAIRAPVPGRTLIDVARGISMPPKAP
jgi:hypothetical protein